MSRKSYHHGDLPRALVDAALSLIGEKGAAGVTFAEAARRAGVSPAAPYRHFRDREALLAEAARRGFELFAARLEAAWDDGRPNPLRAFEAVGRAYLEFARDEPAYFTAMFSAGVDQTADPALFAAGERAFAALLRACDALASSAPPERRPPPHMMAYHVWSLAHGVASLFGHPPGPRAPIPPDALLESLAAVYLRGLGLIPADA